jgi:hypothetical protein
MSAFHILALHANNEHSHYNLCYFSLQVPEGFELCVRLMLPGEMAIVTCPPDYAYDKFPRLLMKF